MSSKKFFTKEKKSLLIFIMIACFLWFVEHLGGTYRLSLEYEVDYVNLPAKKFQATPEQSIKLLVSSKGFSILNHLLFGTTLKIDLSKLLKVSKYEYLLSLPDLKSALQKQLTNNIRLEGFEKNILSFYLGAYLTKKIPIQPNISVDYKLGYDRFGAMKMVPDSVILQGPEMLLDTLKFIKMKKINLSEVSENFEEKIKLPALKNHLVHYESPQEIVLSFAVTKFTEGVFKVPFETINLPKNTEIITEIAYVKLYYKVALKDFSKIQKADFKVVCDYKKATKNSLNFMIPTLKTKPKTAKNIRITPQKINFLVQKK